MLLYKKFIYVEKHKTPLLVLSPLDIIMGLSKFAILTAHNLEPHLKNEAPV